MKRKKTIRNIVIAVVIVALIAAAIVLGLNLRKDGHGLNGFERARTAASAHGTSISMLDYVMTFDTIAQNYSTATLTDEQITFLQENAARQALLIKIYAKEAKERGITLTDEEQKLCKDSAQEQIDAIEKNYTEQLSKSGNFSKATLEKQIADYYAMIGMTQGQYYRYCLERIEANYYMNKLEEYYETNGNDFTEEELQQYYHDAVEEQMESYQPGQYSSSMQMYAYGYSLPLPFVPEGFFYVDYIEVSKDTEEEVRATFNKVINGGKEDKSKFVMFNEQGYTDPTDEGMSFDELLETNENRSMFKNFVDGPYAVGDEDYSYLFENSEVYDAAKALEIGQIGVYILPNKTTDTEGNETVTGYTGYMFRRAEDTMCEEGDSGIIKLDYYHAIRDSIESGLRQNKWTEDITYTDAVHAYRGALQ